MADSDVFTATTSWQVTQANGEDITDGTFTVQRQNTNQVGFIRGTVLPTESNGHFWLDKDNKAHKIDLASGEKLYNKANSGSVVFTVVPA